MADGKVIGKSLEKPGNRWEQPLQREVYSWENDLEMEVSKVMGVPQIMQVIAMVPHGATGM